MLSVAQVAGLTSTSGLPPVVLVGGGTIDLAHLSAIGISSWSIGDEGIYDIVGTDAGDTFDIGQGSATVSAGDGDDTIKISQKEVITDVIDGGAGDDTLRLVSGDVDLSAATLTGIERILVSSNSLSLSESQWQTYGELVERATGATTKFTLSLEQAGIRTLAADSAYQGLSGSQGDDELRGNNLDNVLSGRGGDDLLIGLDGDDRLVAGTGVDNLQGGTGNDVLDVRGQAVVLDRISGGEGADTLLVEDGQDLTGAAISGIEVLRGEGVVRLTAEQVVQFREIVGVSVQIEIVGDFKAPASLILVNGATLLLGNYDSELIGSSGILGSIGNDRVEGSAADDAIYGGRGSDALYGRGGNDLLDGGKGTDFVSGGDGNDVIVVGGASFSQDYQYQQGNSLGGETISGGAGFDTVVVDFNNHGGNWFDFTTGQTETIEALTAKDWNLNHWNAHGIRLEGSLWSALQSIDLQGSNEPWNYGQNLQVEVLGQGGDLNFDAVTANSNFTVRLTGAFDNIVVADNPAAITQSVEWWQPNKWEGYFAVDAQFTSLSLSEEADWVRISSDREYSLVAGAGDDYIYQQGNGGQLRVTVDGGDGYDTFDISDFGFVDLTQSSFENVENIYFGGTTLLLTPAQQASLSLDGNGAIFTLIDGVVTGTSEADNFNGAGFDVFAGGEGDDVISNVGTVLLSGNLDEYDFVLGQNFQIQHARGSLLDGTDTLSNVLALQFADGSQIVVDDAPNEAWNWVYRFDSAESRLAGLSEISYGKNVSGSYNFDGDTDLYAATLVPNSPLTVDFSVTEGSGWYLGLFDAETGQQLSFRSLVTGQEESWFSPGLDNDFNWLPILNGEPYEGGAVIVNVGRYEGGGSADYSFTLGYKDDYAGSIETLGQINPQDRQVQGFIGEAKDSDWIRTELIEGTRYEFSLQGLSSGGGTLLDPKLQLLDANGQAVEQGIDSADGVAGTDDVIIFRPQESGVFYLAVSDVAGISSGSWTLTQKSLDSVAGNVSSTERVEWDADGRFQIEGEVNELTDRDWYRVWLDKGVTYNFNLTGETSGATLANPQLSIRSVTGVLLGFDDDSGEGNSASLIFTANDSGWYFLDAGASGNASRGTFQLDGASLEDDYAANTGTLGQVNLGAPQSGLISYIGDSDWFATGMSAAVTYVIDVKAEVNSAGGLDPLTDPMLIIRDQAGNLIAKIDDFSGTFDARAYFTPDQDGLYFLEVRSSDRFDTGAYQVSVSLAPPDDYPSELLVATAAVDLDAALTGEIGSPGDKDVVTLEVEAGRVYLIDLLGFASNAGTLLDPYLRVFDADGKLIAFDNNSNLGNDARLYFSPESSGTIYLEVSSSASSGLGSYTLVASQRDLPPDDAANNTGTTVQIDPGQAFAGSLLTPGDQDWVRVRLEEGQTYVFRVSASASGAGSLTDPTLQVRDAAGVLLETVDDMLTSNEPALAFTALATGDYYLVVGASEDNDTGSYVLSTRAPDDHGNTIANATELTLDEVVLGGIQWNDGAFGVRATDSNGLATDADQDWFEFSADAGQVLSVSVVAGDGSALSRPMVEVLDAQGNPLALGDGLETDDGRATASFIAPQNGIYYARVIDGAGAIGNYQISVSVGDLSDEDSDGALTLVFLDGSAAREAVYTAVIHLAGDDDTFEVALQAGHTYRIETTPIRDGFQAPLPGSNLQLTWNDDDGAKDMVVSGREGNPSVYASAVLAPVTDGTLALTVSAGDANSTGQYQVKVIDLGLNAGDDRVDVIAEYDDAGLGILAINESAPGKIDDLSDRDLFAVNLSAGNVYQFIIKSYFDGLGTLGQAKLRLLNEAGQLVSVGTYDSETGRTDFSIAVFESGRYFIEVSSENLPGNIGTYTLESSQGTQVENPEDDIAADSQSGVIVTPGAPIAGEIEVAGDRDWIKVSMEAGKVYLIDVLASGDGEGGSLTDAGLRVLDAEGNVLLVDRNSGAGQDARIQFTPEVTGDFYLEVIGEQSATGTYTARVRELFGGVADPLVSAQWYLSASNVTQLEDEYSGAGVTIGIVDDGVDSTHPDLQDNLNLASAFDTQFNTQNGDPKYPPLVGTPEDNHGTQVAGIIGSVANNETGIRGIAPDALMTSVRVRWTWPQMIEALELQWQFDISNNSWGASLPFEDNFNSASMTAAWLAIRDGVVDGRSGLGTIWVFSAGNGAAAGDNTNYHNFQNAREVITVGAVENDGSSAGFSTPGANVHIASYGVGLLTTDRVGAEGNDPGNYTQLSGTSAAASVVTGVIALMLEANPNLGYRDVQKILAYSASHPDAQDWKENAAQDHNLGGLRFNDQSGFGVVDAYAAVQLARTWLASSTTLNEVSASARAFGLSTAIPDGDGDSYTINFEIDSSMTVERLELGVDLSHERLGDLVITLTSPNGTVSVLMDRPTVNAEQPFGLSGPDSGLPNHLLWDFSSTQFWGEAASGTWTISITDVRAEGTGDVASLSLRLFGERQTGDDTYIFTNEGFESASPQSLEDEQGYDVINASPVTYDIVINLTQGVIAANTVSHGIASWTVIERAYAGSGNDSLVGNDADNYLDGGAGSDVLVGGAGSDTLIGGEGADSAVYAGLISEYSVSWNPDLGTVTVVDNKTSNGDEGTDVLTGIERLIFADGERNLSETVGNQAPEINSTYFDEVVYLTEGMGIDFTLPQGLFSDPETGTDKGLAISVRGSQNGDLPDWLSYDESTGKFTGVPPGNFQGQIQVVVEATDEFGETAADELTLQFGDNQAPIIDRPYEMVLDEDAGVVWIGLSVPSDPEGEAVQVTITDIPILGSILDKNGNVVAAGSQMSADEFSELYYRSAPDANGEAGYLRYEAVDETGVTSNSSVHFFIEAVNDAPRFATQDSKLVINYPAESEVALDLLLPNDPESAIDSVEVIELPGLGVVRLDGVEVRVGQDLALEDLNRLIFILSENVNGPIGSVVIRATDSAGAATDWALLLEVSGDAGSSQGSADRDELYGSIGDDALYGRGGNDVLFGNAGQDNLLGGLGNDQLFGGSGNDALDGSAGNDYLDGGLGADFMLGGPGDDIYAVDNPDDIVFEVVSGGAGGNDLILTDVSLTAPDNVENLQASSSLLIDLFGNELDNVLTGNDQANTLAGMSGRDYLYGGGGDDSLDGGTGVDQLVGGLGNDTYYIDSRADRIQELVGQGIDLVITTASFTLPSNVENLTLLGDGDFSLGGNSLDNHLIGNSGANILAGGLGVDLLEGGLGDDIYVLNDDLDTIIDAGGIDTIRSSLSIELLENIENGELVGIANNTITGNGQDNELQGNMGDNTIDGRGGQDTLTGGLGSDQFILSYNGDSLLSDLITDFNSGEDLLVVDLGSFGIDAEAQGLLGSGLVSADSFVKGAGARALDADDFWILDTATGILYFDEDGDGEKEAVEVARFSEGTDFTDFSAGDVFVAI